MSMPGSLPPTLRHQRSKRPKLSSHGSRSNLAGYGEQHDLGAMKPCSRLLREIMRQENLSWPFNKPVDIIKFPDYYTIVPEPIDLGTIKVRPPAVGCIAPPRPPPTRCSPPAPETARGQRVRGPRRVCGGEAEGVG